MHPAAKTAASTASIASLTNNIVGPPIVIRLWMIAEQKICASPLGRGRRESAKRRVRARTSTMPTDRIGTIHPSTILYDNLGSFGAVFAYVFAAPQRVTAMSGHSKWSSIKHKKAITDSN